MCVFLGVNGPKRNIRILNDIKIIDRENERKKAYHLLGVKLEVGSNDFSTKNLFVLKLWFG